jgi:anti-sigma regulatory factor (Ser/Thr protein kinase)
MGGLRGDRERLLRRPSALLDRGDLLQRVADGLAQGLLVQLGSSAQMLEERAVRHPYPRQVAVLPGLHFRRAPAPGLPHCFHALPVTPLRLDMVQLPGPFPRHGAGPVHARTSPRTTKTRPAPPSRTTTTTYGFHTWSAEFSSIHDGRVKHETITPEPHPSAPEFVLQLSSTRRGARLARTLAVQQLTEWCGLPYDSDTARTVALITAELASNAITHGHLPGRNFRLALLLLPPAVRIEVTDTRPERLLPNPSPDPPMPPQAAVSSSSTRTRTAGAAQSATSTPRRCGRKWRSRRVKGADNGRRQPRPRPSA